MKFLFETKTSNERVADLTGLRRPSPAVEPRVAAPRIREAVFDDYQGIAALQIRNGLTTRSFTDWAALWQGNPVYEDLRGRFPIGWVLETGHGEIVGLIGNVPFACHFKGQELRAAAACAWVVDPGYRSYSMRLLDCLMSQPDIDLIVSTTVSSNSEPALKLFEWSKAPVGAWDKSAFWVTNYRGFVRSALKLKSVPMAGVASYPISGALFCRDLIKDWGAKLDGSHHELELCPRFDSRFDGFWDELKEQNDDTLLANRTRKALSWHFRHSLERQRVWILTASRGSHLVAYAIFDRQDNNACGLKRVRLVDFQALKGFESALPSAIDWMLRKCRKDKIHILENVGCWLDRPGLPKVQAPYLRTLPSALYYYKATSSELSEMLRDSGAWAPTTFDGDASL